MIGVAFFAFSSYVCFAQAQKQAKELDANPLELAGMILSAKMSGNNSEDIVAASGLALRQMLFDPIADVVVDSFHDRPNPKPLLLRAWEKGRQKREVSFCMAMAMGIFCSSAAISRTIVVVLRIVASVAVKPIAASAKVRPKNRW
jgi:hypothetical protein